MESILTSIKKMLGISREDEQFDPDIIMHINTALMDLNQIGVGPPEGFMIEDETSEWSDLIPNDQLARLDGIISYIYLRVKLLFDPPSSSAVIESMNRQIEKLEWRINVAAESISKEEIQNGL